MILPGKHEKPTLTPAKERNNPTDVTLSCPLTIFRCDEREMAREHGMVLCSDNAIHAYENQRFLSVIMQSLADEWSKFLWLDPDLLLFPHHRPVNLRECCRPFTSIVTPYTTRFLSKPVPAR